MRGRFITFEGGEGAGKSTQVRLLAKRLRERGSSVVETREPGGTPLAERIRELILDGRTHRMQALTEALLFAAARSSHLDERIRPALKAGSWVVSDRFMDSTRAYQGAAGGMPDDALLALERMVVGPDRPDLTLILDVSPEAGLGRARARNADAGTDAAGENGDRFEARQLAFHQRLRQGFLDFARAEPSRCAVIDGGSSPDQVASEVWRIVAGRFGL